MPRSSALIAALLFSAHTLTAHADDATKRAKVDEMLSVTKTDSLSERMLTGVPTRVKALASQQPMVAAATSPAQKKIADDYLNEMAQIASSAPTWAVLKPKVVEIYLATFTEADLDGIIAFFKTPAGQDYIAKSPELSGKTVQVLQGSVNALAPKFEAATRAFQAKMEGTSPSTPAAAPAKAPTLGPPTAASPK